jgi:hypothetical protein
MKHLKCAKCRQSVSSEVPDNTVLRGTIICSECLDCMPYSITNKFLKQWIKVRKDRREVKMPSEYVPGSLKPEEKQKPREVRYGIGQDDGKGGVGMSYGIFPNLQQALDIYPGYIGNYLLFRFNSNGSDELLYTWNGEKWILEKEYTK